jgi:uncharacterized protein
VATDPLPDRPDEKPRRTTRRRLFQIGLGLVAGTAGVGAYSHWIEPTWVQVVRTDLPVAHLSPAWEGLRVVLIADLHYGMGVPLDYLAEVVRKVKAEQPDLVALAGDFVLGSDPESAEQVAALFQDLAPPYGVWACLGNHDYRIPAAGADPRRPASGMTAALRRYGVRTLCNESVRLERRDQYLWMAGADDLWNGSFNPGDVTRGLPAGAPNLVLCHNPDATERLEAVGCGTILAGHTHGGQVQVPLLGPVHLPVRFRHRYEGLYQVGGAWLYITRGVGWLYKVRFNCRPEISVLTLKCAVEEKPAATLPATVL